MRYVGRGSRRCCIGDCFISDRHQKKYWVWCQALIRHRGLKNVNRSILLSQNLSGIPRPNQVAENQTGIHFHIQKGYGYFECFLEMSQLMQVEQGFAENNDMIGIRKYSEQGTDQDEWILCSLGHKQQKKNGQ
jgi:hypothetical protein